MAGVGIDDLAGLDVKDPAEDRHEYTGLINKSKENIVKNKMQYITLVNFIKSPSSKIHLWQ